MLHVLAQAMEETHRQGLVSWDEGSSDNITGWWLRPTPPKKYVCSSVGMILPNIWKDKICSKPPTRLYRAPPFPPFFSDTTTSLHPETVLGPGLHSCCQAYRPARLRALPGWSPGETEIGEAGGHGKAPLKPMENHWKTYGKHWKTMENLC
jgi:hypothetical protein